MIEPIEDSFPFRPRSIGVGNENWMSCQVSLALEIHLDRFFPTGASPLRFFRDSEAD
jgi:hypothetical protein